MCLPTRWNSTNGSSPTGLGRPSKGCGRRRTSARYGLSHSDAYLAWIMASAYQGEGWSPFCRDTELRDLAVRLLDALTAARLKEPFPGENHPIVFGLHGYAFAVLRWKETGAVPQEKLDRWVEGVGKSAEFAIRYTARGQFVGDYANPEMYYLSGLAAAWKLTGEPRYRGEAAAALRRYRDDTFPDGGVAYFRGTNAKVGYQQMVVKAVCLYYELTGDAYAKELLDCYAKYFPMVYHQAGIFSPSEHPWLKHYVGEYVNPAVPDMIASVTGDGPQRDGGEDRRVPRRRGRGVRFPFLHEQPRHPGASLVQLPSRDVRLCCATPAQGGGARAARRPMVRAG